MNKICFYKVNHGKNIKDEPWILCSSEYVPLTAEPVLILPYPIMEQFLFGDGKLTCKELFEDKFDHDFERYKKEYTQYQTTFNFFKNIKESYEI